MLTGRGWRQLAGLALVATAAGTALAYVLAFGVDVPILDDYDYLATYCRLREGGLTLGEFFAQHNEHRVALPRAVIVVIDLVSGANQRAIMVASWASLAATVAVAWRALPRGTPFYLAGVAIAVFTVRQWENLLMGSQVLIPLCAFLVLLSFVLLDRGHPGWSIASAVCASTTFAAGMLVWPAGAIHLLLRGRPARRTLLLWLVAAGTTAIAYFWHYIPPAAHPPLGFALRHPLVSLEYFLVSLGNPFGVDRWTALSSGALIAFLSAVAMAREVRAPNGISAATISFGLGFCLLLTAGRAGFGVDQAFSSRYSTLALLATAGVLFRDARDTNGIPLGGAIAGMLACTLVATLHHGFDLGPRIRADRLEKRWILKTLDAQTDELASGLIPVQFLPDVRRIAAFLRERRLSAFREPDLPTAEQPGGPAEIVIEEVNGGPPIRRVELAAGSMLDLRGWAGDAARAARGVVLEIDGSRRLPAYLGAYRPDVAAARNDGDLEFSGFRAAASASWLGPGPHTVRLLVLGASGYRTSEVLELDVR